MKIIKTPKPEIDSGLLLTESDIKTMERKLRMSWVKEIEKLLGVSQDNRGKYTVKIVVGSEGKAFYLNRALLLQTSEYFVNLLENSAQDEYVLESVDLEAFEEIVKHIHLISDWQFAGDLEKACTLLHWAIELQVVDLVGHIYAQVMDALKVHPNLIQEHVAGFLFDIALSLKDDGRNLQAPVLDYIERNAMTVLSHRTAVDLHETSLVKILQSDKLVLESELDAFKMILRWGIHHLEVKGEACDIPNLRMVLKQPLKCIRFQNMTQQEFRLYVQPTGILDSKLESKIRTWLSASERERKSSGMCHLELRPQSYSQHSTVATGSMELFIQKTQADLFQSSLRAEMDASTFRITLKELQDKIADLENKVSEKNDEFTAFKKANSARVRILETDVGEKDLTLSELRQDLDTFRQDAKDNLETLNNTCAYTRQSRVTMKWTK